MKPKFKIGDAVIVIFDGQEFESEVTAYHWNGNEYEYQFTDGCEGIWYAESCIRLKEADISDQFKSFLDEDSGPYRYDNVLKLMREFADQEVAVRDRDWREKIQKEIFQYSIGLKFENRYKVEALTQLLES